VAVLNYKKLPLFCHKNLGAFERFVNVYNPKLLKTANYQRFIPSADEDKYNF